MSRLDDAEARLTAAIGRLEAALAKVSNRAGETQMAAALEHARRDYTALREKADAAGGRLDATIDRLRAIIDDGPG